MISARTIADLIDLMDTPLGKQKITQAEAQHIVYSVQLLQSIPTEKLHYGDVKVEVLGDETAENDACRICGDKPTC